MKKLLLFACFLFLYTANQAQVSFYAVSPNSVKGNYAFSYPTPAGGWGVPDMTIPANSIQDTLMIVDDGTASDSLGCNALVNSLKGKIAVVYRGACEFGVKAKNAQDSGAVGVIVVNHSPGTLNMGPGAQGANVTIPVVMISNSDGARLRAEMDLGNSVEVFIGNKLGLYANDLGMYRPDVFVARATANPKLISSNATEWNVPMGTWVHNYGSATQSNVTVTAYITGAVTTQLTSSPAVSINVGDSAYISIGTYSASSYSGLYKVNYIIDDGTADGFPGDNIFYSNFLIDSLYSFALVDSTTNLTTSSVHSRVSGSVDYKICTHFMDANASRLAAMGEYFSAYPALNAQFVLGDISGETVYTELFEWNDVFTGLSDPAFPPAPWNLKKITGGSYTFLSNNEAGKMMYVPFDSAKVLKDNQRYLFCAWHSKVGDEINLGLEDRIDYTHLLDSTDQPISIVIADTNEYATGYGPTITSSVTPKFGPQDVSVSEYNKHLNITPYPNPTTNFVIIPLKGLAGKAKLDIMDLTGRVMNTQTVKVADTVYVNVKDVPSGNYIFNMVFENGNSTTFKVVITK